MCVCVCVRKNNLRIDCCAIEIDKKKNNVGTYIAL